MTPAVCVVLSLGSTKHRGSELFLSPFWAPCDLGWCSLVAGGTFALYSLLCRAIGIGPFGQSLSIDYSTMESYSSNMYDDSAPPPRWCCSIHSRVGIALRNYYRRSKVHQVALLVVVVLATAMVVGDGVLTPSISGGGLFIYILNNNSIKQNIVLAELLAYLCHVAYGAVKYDCAPCDFRPKHNVCIFLRCVYPGKCEAYCVQLL